MSRLGFVPRELRRWLRRAEQAGWEVRKTAGNHIRVYPTDCTQAPITISSTPSDAHAVKNAIADLRRAGLTL